MPNSVRGAFRTKAWVRVQVRVLSRPSFAKLIIKLIELIKSILEQELA